MRTRRRSARLAGVLLLTPLISLSGPVPAAIAAPAGGAGTAVEDAPAASSYPASSVTLAGAAGTAPVGAAGVEPAGGLETAKTTRPVAPGLDLTTRRATPPRPRRASSVTARRRRWSSSGWPTSSTAPARARSSSTGTSAPSTPTGWTECRT